ncbi:antibiotic biosynthesis monooxygenase [Haemophilus pittmaniae HK 85]|jgi:hypothetical protein|uniref:Antibiotic biosynthesis monooxygenase n=1 Tax=Haemophilus pittmaniae HK 85 TaxID=1035188 RepID=F9Q887_9PAST|nr:putative quinol monooxygenase [Haemophilus pittmaniae]EGV06252.1 antibiotic biosynthesis monooxygenase [Haemophilus pittmaniae HK 85]SNV71071.1 Putative monooxygenase ycnE [Haemophilus pittmaniae]
MIGVYATGLVKTDQQAAFIELAQQFIKESRTHAGCISYDCGAVNDKPGYYCFIERWADKQALDAHLASPFFQQHAPQLVALLENGLDINVLELI